jgi:hypothetical protein
MKILLYVPLAPKTPRIYAKTIQSIFRLDWEEPLPIVFGREDNPLTDHYVNLTAKHNQARQMVLDGGFDALFLVENDMILPVDVLKRLVAMPSDISYGLYCERHRWHRWLSFFYIDEVAGVSYSQDIELARKVWGRAAKSSGVGLGCTLIHRRVLEQIEFTAHPDNKVADDWMLALDAESAGFVQGHDFGCICGHMMPNGQVIWPSIDTEGLYTIEFPGEPVVTQITPGHPLVITTDTMGTQTIYGQKGNSPSIPN